MSEFPPIDDLVGALMEDPDARIRAEAARLIGEMSHTLAHDDRTFARQALDRAMLDNDPMVLMSVMTAIGKFPPASPTVSSPVEDDESPVKASACPVCGRPEALVDPNNCDYSNCPYKG